jgi:hypothetical protein
MDAALYFELVDAVARVDKQSDLATVSERVMETPMHPLERRVLERALRARSEALALQGQLVLPGLYQDLGVTAKPLAAGG